MTHPLTTALRVCLSFCWLLTPLFAQAQAPPTLVFPKNNFVTSGTSPSLEWNVNASALSYHVQIAENTAFAPLSQESLNVTGTTFATTLVSGKKYYWRVRANTAHEDTG